MLVTLAHYVKETYTELRNAMYSVCTGNLLLKDSRMQHLVYSEAQNHPLQSGVSLIPDVAAVCKQRSLNQLHLVRFCRDV